MSLACTCDVDGGGDWYWEVAADFSVLGTARARKCCSCGKRVESGTTVVAVWRTRGPRSDYEESRFGDDYDAVVLATHYMCEDCGGLYYSFQDLGFRCVSPYESMTKLAQEYAETYQRRKGHEG